MKRFKYLYLLIAAIFLLAACTAQNGEESPAPSEPTEAVQGTIDEYFPFAENAMYTYERSDAYGSNKTFIVYMEGNKMQRITTALDLVITEVLEYANGELKVNYAQTSASGFESFMNQSDEYQITVLKEPLSLGNTWETYSGTTILGVAKGVCTITGVDVEIETPYGTYNALEVSTEFENGYTNVDYYAKGIGLIKNGYFIKGFTKEDGESRTYADDVTADLLLTSFETGTPYSLEINTYYPNENADSIESGTIACEFSTNQSMEQIFEGILKNPGGGETSRLISDSTKINFIDVIWESHTDPETKTYKETATVHVDFSKDFITDMNAGSGYEALLLESLEYTFRDFYKAVDFLLTVDKKPYVSGH